PAAASHGHSRAADHATLTVAERACRTADWLDASVSTMWWCWGKGTSVICWQITRPTTTGCARTLRSTRMLRSIDLRRPSGVSHQSLGSAVSIGTTFGWHNRYTQGAEGLSFELLNRSVDQPFKYLGIWLV